MRSLVVLLVVAGGCGEDRVASPGGGGEPSPDAAPGPDADPRGVITVSALSGGGPVAAATVLITDGDGTRATSTDAGGVATATVNPGASVTVIRVRDGRAAISTVLGVEPGDQLVLGDRAAAPDAVGGTMTFRHGALDGAARYAVSNGCVTRGSVGLVATVPFEGPCAGGRQDLLVLAETAGGVLLATAAVQGVTVADGAAVELASSFTPAVAFTASYGRVPADVVALAVSHATVHAGREYHSSGAQTTPAAGAAVATLTVPAFGDARHLGVTLRRAIESTTSSQTIVARLGAASTPAARSRTAPAATIDLEPQLLPWLTAARFDAATRTLSWTATGPGDADGTAVILTYGDRGTTHQWTVTAPPGTTQIVFPVLPAELAAVDLTAASAVSSAFAAVVERSATDGYRGFRQRPQDIAGLARPGDSERVRVSTVRLP